MDAKWITSGSIGSRDAVLVFRPTVLKENSAINITTIAQRAETSKESTVKQSHSSSLSKQPTKLLEKIDQNPLVNQIGTRANSYNEVLPFINTNLVEKVRDHTKGSRNFMFRENSIPKQHLTSAFSNKGKFGIFDTELRVVKQSDTTNNENSSLHISSYGNCTSSNSDDDDLKDISHIPNMPARKLQIKYKFVQTETKLLKKIFTLHGLTEVQDKENFSILWTGIHIKPDILRNLVPYQRVNHFPRSYELTRKDRLYKNIEKMQHLRGIKNFDIVPQSFILPMEYKELISAHNKTRGLWIVKPAASSRGRGIFIVESPNQIPKDESVLVCKYVLNPLCIDGHKCDLRVYVLVTSFDPLIIYLYEEGLVRLATVKYDRDLENLWNPCMHLCNYSINKYHSDYIKSLDGEVEDVGHKWTLSALLRHLKAQGCNTHQLMASIEDLIIKSLFACAQTIISACSMFVPSGSNCFELYGFDILIDDNLKPWLLEANLSPSMGIDSPLDSKVKACLITDLLTCIGIPAYSSDTRAQYDNRWTRFRNIKYYRRSADNVLCGNNNDSQQLTTMRIPQFLSTEEQRIVKNARLQNVRRGGFVRIFPTHDSMHRYGNFLDSSTGIPISTPAIQGQFSSPLILPHNYNKILFNDLYVQKEKETNSFLERMWQYERALPVGHLVLFSEINLKLKCVEIGKRLRKQILKLIDGGSELTQLQARQTFSHYLESISHRLSKEPKDFHEKIILKFLKSLGGSAPKATVFRNPHNFRVNSKTRSAMVAKLLADFVDQYNRDTEANADSFDHFGMIPRSLFDDFLSQAQESDLEAVLVHHTNVSGNMSYLYSRFGLSVPQTPPIPSGLHGFLKALPAMVLTGSVAREFNKLDGYCKSN